MLSQNADKFCFSDILSKLRKCGEIIFNLCTSSSINTNFFDQLDGHVGYKTLNHQIVCANKKFLQCTGYKDLKHVEGKTDSDLSWGVYSDYYLKHEKDALSNQIYSSLHPSKDNSGRDFLSLDFKYPWINEQGQLIGIMFHTIEVEDVNLIELWHVLNNTSSSVEKKIYYSGDTGTLFPGLSRRESECLFYIIHGKSARKIAVAMNISHRTVEVYIENLKIKFNCHSKSDLIEAAINNGFVNVIPNSFLRHNSVKFLSEF